MTDEALVGVEQNDSSMDKWKPAIKAGLALIAVLVVVGIFQIFYTIVLSDYLQPLWALWTESSTGKQPVYTAIYYLLDGVLLLVMADILVMNKGWFEALVDELQLKISKQALNYLLIGLIVGAVGVTVLNIVQTLSGAYLLDELLYVGLMPESIAVAVFFIIPLLIQCVGQVALVQGYFQRMISKSYGWAAGLIAAAFIYMLIFAFPDIPSLLRSSSDPELFLILGTLIVSSFIQVIIIGAIIAYLFARSKSLYLPIGFIFAWRLFYYAFDGFVSLRMNVFYPTAQGYSMYLIPSVLQVLIPFLALAFVWYFWNDSPEGLSGLKCKLQTAVNFFRYHDEEE